MAVDYTPGDAGTMAVAKGIAVTKVMQDDGDEAREYPAGATLGPVAKPVMSPNVNVVKGKVTATATGNTGGR